MSNGNDGDDNMKRLWDLKELRVRVTRNHYLTLVTLVGILFFLGTAYRSYLQLNIVSPNAEKLKTALAEVKTLEAVISNLTDKNSKLVSSNKVLRSEQELPTLIFPRDDATIIGSTIEFIWEYKANKDSYNQFILEIHKRGCNKDNEEVSSKCTYKYNVLNPELNKMYLPIRKGWVSGEYIWRIVPGRMVVEGVVSDKGPSTKVVDSITSGPGSLYGSFATYKNPKEKITMTSELVVGISPNLFDNFTILDDEGRLSGFDIELSEWLRMKLAKKWGFNEKDNKLVIKFMDLPWEGIFENLGNFKVDMLISSITSTEKREHEHPGMKFTTGYHKNRMIFVRKTTGKNENTKDCNKCLEGKIVGAQAATTNQSVAVALSGKYRFEVKDSFETTSAVFKGLMSGQVDFALVDKSLFDDYLGVGLEDIKYKYLDKELKEFYKKEFNRESDHYAVAVTDAPYGEGLKDVFNDFLCSMDGQSKLVEIEKSFGNGDSDEQNTFVVEMCCAALTKQEQEKDVRCNK